MADATITRVFPVFNKKKTGPKHFGLGIEGTNFAATTTVTATYTKNGKTYNWEVDNLDVHSSTLLAVKLKRKQSDTDEKKEAEGIRQIEQITVTVSNPMQPTPGTLNTPGLVVDL